MLVEARSSNALVLGGTVELVLYCLIVDVFRV